MEILLTIWKPLIEILILWFVFYRLLVFIRDTRAFQVLMGLLILAVFFIITQRFNFEVINWILTKLFAISVIAFVIIFQPELRRGLARLGQNRLLGFLWEGGKSAEEVVKAVLILAKKKMGALIAIEREIGLRPFIESGVALDSMISTEMISALFMPNTPLHDGGMVLQGTRVAAAGCLFPLTQNPHISKTLGTRHRAAIGLAEETDAVVIIVSEETGDISVAMDGQLRRGFDAESLKAILDGLYEPKPDKRLVLDLFSPERLVWWRQRH